MDTDYDSIKRLDAVNEVLTSLRDTFPDAKVFGVEVRWEWQETRQSDLDDALCPVVKIHIER